MSAKKPLVLTSGQIQQLQAGDTLDASCTEVDVVSMVNANVGAIVIGSPVYVSVAGSVDLARANAAGTVEVLGLVKTTSITASESGSIQTDGVLVATDIQWKAVNVGGGSLVAGSVYYLDQAAAGKITATAPTTGYIVRIGVALSVLELDITTTAPMKL